MAHFEWKDEYLVHNEEIDAQHMQLLELANLLLAAVGSGKDEAILKGAFDALLQYTEKHFQDEEALFEKIGSPMLEEHKRQHEKLSGEVRALWMDEAMGFIDGMGRILEEWVETHLVPHMIEDDQKAASVGPKPNRMVY